MNENNNSWQKSRSEKRRKRFRTLVSVHSYIPTHTNPQLPKTEDLPSPSASVILTKCNYILKHKEKFNKFWNSDYLTHTTVDDISNYI